MTTDCISVHKSQINDYIVYIRFHQNMAGLFAEYLKNRQQFMTAYPVRVATSSHEFLYTTMPQFCGEFTCISLSLNWFITLTNKHDCWFSALYHFEMRDWCMISFLVRIVVLCKNRCDKPEIRLQLLMSSHPNHTSSKMFRNFKNQSSTFQC